MFTSSGATTWRQKLFGLFSSPTVDLAAFEALLFEADFSFEFIEQVLKTVQKNNPKNANEAKTLLMDLMQKEFSSVQGSLEHFEAPRCILMVGVNGVGKTTSTAKLAHTLKLQGQTVMVCAADTFRAGAIEQLKKWGEKLGVEVVSQAFGSDPASVVFEAWEKAQKNKAILLIDTAGRMHTKDPLMDQLKKIKRVLEKSGGGAPHEIWMVLDATTGQNALKQAQEFNSDVALSGVVVTKLDGTAKGGAALTIAKRLNKPIRFVGVGEQEQALKPFELKTYLEGLFSQG